MSKPKTAEQWFALDDLPTELGIVFTPEKEWKHDISNTYEHCEMNRFACTKCHKCIENLSHKYISGVPGRTVYSSDEPCPVPDPIKIDWNTAKYWQGKIDPPLKFFRELYMVVFDRERDSINIQEVKAWVVALTQPEDAKIPLIAAAMAMERSK